MQTILSALLLLVKTIKGVKSGPGKYCYMKNIFLEKSYTILGRKTIPRPFPKRIKIEQISRSIVQFYLKSGFIVYQVEGYRNILKLKLYIETPFTPYKVFLKNKRGFGTSLNVSISA